jgi:hypothetical protein
LTSPPASTAGAASPTDGAPPVADTLAPATSTR